MAQGLQRRWSFHVVALSLWTALSWRTAAGNNGMTAQQFRDVSSIQEVECSGLSLDADADLMSMTFFTSKDKRVLGYVNFGKGECSTSEVFVLCEIDAKDSKRTRLKALVSDLGAGETREFGCNVTSLKSGGWTKTFSWTVSVNSSRMRAEPFRGLAGVQEVVCSAEALDLGEDVSTMALFAVQGARAHVLATVIPWKNECTTSSSFAACVVVKADLHATRLRALVMDLREEEVRLFGCNVTTVRPRAETSALSWTLLVKGISLLVRAFRGEASILEVECTGDSLSADVDVFQMTLYTAPDSEMVAYVNPLKNECLTSRSFSSCIVDEKDSRRTRLRSLVLDFGPKETRLYGCNVSSSQARSAIKVTSWSVLVKRLRLTVAPFFGIPSVQEVTCSGDALEANTDVLTMYLFSARTNKILAYVHPLKNECLTSESFSSCEINLRETQKTKVKTLVMELGQWQASELGCNVSYVKSRESTRIASWRLSVRAGRLTARLFKGIPSVQEVECTGSGLNAGSDVLTITLYNVLQHRVLAYVNLNNKECSTSFIYAACIIGQNDSRKSRLVALVTDLKDSEYVLLGCNVSTFRAGVVTSTSWTVAVRGGTMAVRLFQGLRTVQEVECTGHFLTPASDLFSLTLYNFRDNSVIAYANLRSGRCSTSGQYSACFMDQVNTRGTRLVTLLHDLGSDETRMYGCNVSSFQFGRVMLRSWRITVRSQGEAAGWLVPQVAGLGSL